jgi:hypothetical protein
MSPAAAAIFNPLYGLEGGQIAPTLQQMTPAIYADALSVNRSTFQMNSMFIDRELEARRGSPRLCRHAGRRRFHRGHRAARGAGL